MKKKKLILIKYKVTKNFLGRFFKNKLINKNNMLKLKLNNLIILLNNYY